MTGFGGFSPYLASYSAANSASFSGWQTKHCESGRSCLLHQSPLALKSPTSFTLHRAHTSSGTPCSSHHQPSRPWPAFTTLPSLAGVAATFSVDLLQALSEAPIMKTKLHAAVLR